MLRSILQIAFLCVALGSASIPISFNINSSPWIVWLGNGLGSLFSAALVIYIGNKITDVRFKKKISKRRVGKKVVNAFDEGQSNGGVKKARDIINKRGLKLFSLICPLFPGVLISTVAVYILDLDRSVYKKWMFAGVFFVSFVYVFGFWWLFVK